MILVYTHKITPRITYIFKHIFVRVLNSQVSFTTKIEDFVAHNGVKFTYSKVALGSEFFIRSHDLLFEQGINDIEISMQKWKDDVPCFFNAGKKSSIPFDVFAASFYLLTRYEEYLPHVQDALERFPAEESLAFKNDFLEKPVIDIWAYALKEELQLRFPEHNFEPRKYKYLSLFTINEAFIYRAKGVVRSTGGFIFDFFSLKLSAFWSRAMVLLKISKDPYDTFGRIVSLQRKYKVNTSIFFLIANFTTFDTNISLTKNKFRLLIKSMSDYVNVGLNASFFTMKNVELLKKEMKKLEAIINIPTLKTKQHMLRLDLPESYQNLIDLEVEEDYSMGYPQYLGFRASTCTPFYFYDLDFEIQTPLKVVPFAVSDHVLKERLGLSEKQALRKIKEIHTHVKKVDGTFVTLFHNELLSNYGEWKGWKHFYEQVIVLVNE
ncbi:polysaccharide deacetylase family protein [Flavicella sediminum]|uniref:polysaccharide deacetylase family protein n=1 Tax=Flavicella sediminum TaxID=2585141 RepID=UPI001122379E|nr:polysaccharide deacetylase family protein [Flavicella sediminum]